jgi:hypothetical protein
MFFTKIFKHKYRILKENGIFYIERRFFIFFWSYDIYGTKLNCKSLDQAYELLNKAYNGEYQTKTFHYSDKKLKELALLKDIIQ